MLMRIEEGGAYANVLLRESDDMARLQASDRALVTELVYGTVAWKKRLAYALQAYTERDIATFDGWFRLLLLMAFYQLLFLSRIPPYAVVSETVALAKRFGHDGHAKTANAVLRAYTRDPSRAAPPKTGERVRDLALRLSYPEWLVERWVAQYGEQAAERLMETANAAPRLFVRLNGLKPDAEDVVRRTLAERGATMTPVEGLKRAYVVHGPASVLRDLIEGGWLTVQDVSAQLVAHALRPLPGQRIFDACAAPGGKATHIAELVGDEGEIVAADVHAHKIRRLEREKARLGLRALVVIQEDATAIRRLPRAHFDRVLVDAPCSGLGTLGRKPEIKWRLRPPDLASLAAKQRAILRGVAPYVAPGGLLVYSTCTLNREENEEAVYVFLRETTNFIPDPTLIDDLPDWPNIRAAGPGMVEVWPGETGGDGFFIARLKCIESIPGR